ncbi:MAG: hypothetical protein C0505_06100 [Leptothrix sp. (in: Bacteria)]|nr:hypothetical protein [Leptothrix sp. (in: b-proteobacteria)]
MTSPPRPTPPTHLLYLHGFRSSPKSFKAQRLARWSARHRPEVHGWCPQLPASPREAMALVVPGSDHALSDFDHHLPHIPNFLQLK